MLSIRALSCVLVVVLIHVSSVAAVDLLKFTPDSWDQSNGKAIYEYGTKVIAKQTFASDIHKCVEEFANGQGLKFTTRSKDMGRYMEKFNLSLEKAKEIYNKADVSSTSETLKSKAYDAFDAFRDLSRCRIAPFNGNYMDVSSVMPSLIDHLDTCLTAKNHQKDETWTNINARVDHKGVRNKNMFRLFINLTPDLAGPEFANIGSEIQVIASSDIAVSFTANSLSKHGETSFPSPFSLIANGKKLAHCMAEEQFATNPTYKENVFKRFEDCDKFNDFKSFFDQEKKIYDAVDLE